MPLQPCGGWTQHALFNPWSVFQLAHAHAHSHDHHDTIFTHCFLLLSWNWIDFPFFLLSFDCFDFLGLFSSICFGRNALAASSLVGRSIFICFVLVDLASDDGSETGATSVVKLF